MRTVPLIRKCDSKDETRILYIINKAAKIYKGAIPEERYHEPYMPIEELRREMGKMTFYGYEDGGQLIGVMGFQPFREVALIRHAYVLPEHQRRGVGGKLLKYLRQRTSNPTLLVGTWKNAEWAIRFYEKHGFRLLQNKEELLRKYWDISQCQVETSVVLGIDLTLSRRQALLKNTRP